MATLLSETDAEERSATPPHNTLAEEVVLGSVLKQPGTMAKLTDLPAVDFYHAKYRVIWQAMLDLWRRNQPVDYATVDARLQAPDLAAARIGISDLAVINLSVPSAAHAEHYARLIIDAATQRRHVDAAQKIAEKFWPNGVNVDELAQEAEALLAAARPRRSSRDLYDPKRWADAFMSDLEARADGQRTAVETGLMDVNRMTLGLEAGGLYLLMATPGTGKTELAMQIAIHVGKQYGVVLFVSLEMTAVELAHRYARISTGLDRNRLAKGTLDDDESERALKAMNAMTESRFWAASPTAQYTTIDLRADALEVQTKAGHVALIVADYVQRFRDRSSRTSTREENVGLVAENLKSLAREFGCPVLAPVQPNRDYVGRSSKRPVLSDLRESGKLEQEADVVLGLYRDEKHSDDPERMVAELHMLKNRSGVGDSEGVRKLAWCGTRYGDYTAKQAPAWAA